MCHCRLLLAIVMLAIVMLVVCCLLAACSLTILNVSLVLVACHFVVVGAHEEQCQHRSEHVL